MTRAIDARTAARELHLAEPDHVVAPDALDAPRGFDARLQGALNRQPVAG
jgi:hypothetical protein